MSEKWRGKGEGRHGGVRGELGKGRDNARSGGETSHAPDHIMKGSANNIYELS